MNQNGLVELGFSGPKFTWSNKRYGKHHIRERIEIDVANTKWTVLFPDAKLLHMPIHSSNHAPLLLHIIGTKKVPRPFKFEEFWVRDSTSFSVVVKAWDKFIEGSSNFILIQKLNVVEKALKIWNRQHFGHI